MNEEPRTSIEDTLTGLFIQARSEALREAERLGNVRGIITSTPYKVSHLTVLAKKSIEALIKQAELRARIDEADRIPNPSFISGTKRVEPLREYKIERIAELHAELEQAD